MAADGRATRVERYAELAVRVGANVQPGQLVFIAARDASHAPVVRAMARAAYAAGARYVDVNYVDSHVRRAMIEYAPDDVLEWAPPWQLARAEAIGAERAALLSTTGDPEPELLADLDGDRVARARQLPPAATRLAPIRRQRLSCGERVLPTAA